MKRVSIIFCVFTTLLFGSCRQHEADRVHIQKSNIKKDNPYIEWNRNNVEREEEDISFFIQRYGWDMQKTGTGLYIQTLEEGDGPHPKEGDIISLEYTTILLTGDTVYHSAKDGLKRFKVDKSDEPAGLNEAVKMLRKNAKARIVIPSFLAYGIAGDGQNIRGKVSLAMYIKVIDIQESKL